MTETNSAFKSVTDVERSVVTQDRTDLSVPEGHVLLRTSFEHRAFGRVSLGLAPVARIGAAHPIEATVHAEAFSHPVDLWTKDHRRAAKRLTTWSETVLVALAGATGAAYGAIGIESVFPEPDELARAAAERVLRPHTWFWSNKLSTSFTAEATRLRSTLPSDDLRQVEGGYILRGWSPGNPADDASVGKVLEFLAAARTELG